MGTCAAETQDSRQLQHNYCRTGLEQPKAYAGTGLQVGYAQSSFSFFLGEMRGGPVDPQTAMVADKDQSFGSNQFRDFYGFTT